MMDNNKPKEIMKLNFVGIEPFDADTMDNLVWKKLEIIINSTLQEENFQEKFSENEISFMKKVLNREIPWDEFKASDLYKSISSNKDVQSEFTRAKIDDLVWDQLTLINFVSQSEGSQEKFSENEIYFIKKVLNREIPWDEFKTSDLYKNISSNTDIQNEFTRAKEKWEKDKVKAEEYLATTQINWAAQKDIINSYIVDYLGLGDLDMPVVDVVISTHGGSYDRTSKQIRWGHPDSEKDPANDGRYLFHEWVHAVEDIFKLPKGKAPNGEYVDWEQTHAVLELADTFLYKKLLGGKENRGGHSQLDTLRNKIKPDFIEFLEGHGEAKNFFEFREQMIEKFPIKTKDVEKKQAGKTMVNNFSC